MGVGVEAGDSLADRLGAAVRSERGAQSGSATSVELAKPGSVEYWNLQEPTRPPLGSTVPEKVAVVSPLTVIALIARAGSGSAAPRTRTLRGLAAVVVVA